MHSQTKINHSMEILSIQIDNKIFQLLSLQQFNNIKLSFFASHRKVSFFHYVRLLDTLK